MVLKRRQRTHDIRQYRSVAPIDELNDLIKITLSNDEVLYAVPAKQGTWKLDRPLLPINLASQLKEVGGSGITVKRCVVGSRLELVVDCSYYRMNCEFTTPSTVTGLRPAKRSSRLILLEKLTAKIDTWIDRDY